MIIVFVIMLQNMTDCKRISDRFIHPHAVQK